MSAVNGIHPDEDSGEPIYVGTTQVKLRGHLLRCRWCGSDMLHHYRVTTFERAEDAETTAVTCISKWYTSVSSMPSHGSGNPSSRRHGLSIAFWCEDCDRNAELTISQHKGSTILDWREALNGDYHG
jgi:hypothetical protein